MSDQWIVIEDKRRHDKRWVEIEDTANKKRYSGYFPLSSPDTAVIHRFKQQVRTYRAEVARKQSNLNLTNFEVGLLP